LTVERAAFAFAMNLPLAMNLRTFWRNN